MKKHIITKGSLLASVTLLGLLFAQTAYAQTLQDIACDIFLLINPVIGILVGLMILVFVWGLVKFINNAGDEAARKEGKQIMLWGIIAFFVMSSLWGLVGLIQGSFDVYGGIEFEACGGSFR